MAVTYCLLSSKKCASGVASDLVLVIYDPCSESERMWDEWKQPNQELTT
jgi:hypothetical protein